MNRPAKKNAMTVSMYTAIADLLNDADNDDDIRVVVLHGAGDSFTAGNDLGDFQRNPPKAVGSPQARFTDALIAFSKPLVAAVHGAAVGGGTTMLLHFDFVYAAESAKFQMPFVDLAFWCRSWDRVIWLLLGRDTSRLLNSFCWVHLSMRGGLWSWGS
jgi:enoyl-CoA hydratase/carnithine racemase